MELTPLVGDLDDAHLAALLPGRPIRTYPAALSAEADALAWAREGAATGSLVVAEYQASPRGRGGIEWTTSPGVGFIFSLVVCPDTQSLRDGWIYLASSCGLADALGDGAELRWPDEVWLDERRAAAVGVQVGGGDERIEWAVITVLVERVVPPRAPVLAQVVEAIERRCAAPAMRVTADYRRSCTTMGRSVRARLVPMGPAGKEVVGEAVGLFPDGSLVVQTEGGRRVMVPPSSLGFLEDAAG